MSRTVVTAGWLEEMRRHGRDIAVPRDALVTPAARDWMRETAYPVRWIDEGNNGSTGKASTGGRQLGVVGDLSQPSLRSLRTELERIRSGADAFDAGPGNGTVADGRSQLAAVQRLCAAVQRGEVSRGLILCEEGAVAACIANKFRGVRACIGQSVPAFDQAIRELGINVLVIEVRSRTFHEMRQMVRRLMSSDAQPAEAVGRAIAAAEASQTECVSERFSDK